MTTRFLLCPVLVLAGLAAVLGNARAQYEPEISGAGSTFAAPLYKRWAQEYYDKTGLRVNYYAIGSGAGIRQITARTFDFGASDAPMSDRELKAAPGILHVPTVAGAVVVAYHVPGVGPGIHLTDDVIADIFLGRIARWNDPRISRLSPGTNFPDLPILTAHRADGSGTTDIFGFVA